MTEQFLEIKNVTKIFVGGLIGSRKLAAVDNVNITIEKSNPKSLSIVGESGKTTLAHDLAVDPAEQR